MRPQLVRRCVSTLTATACVWFMLGISECSSPDVDLDGWTVDAGDCNDEDATIYPGALEQCDGLDRSCDGLPSSVVEWYGDGDGDGFGSGAASTTRTCTAPTGMVPQAGDCDDANASRFPGATEQCDLVDNDCDLGVDEGLAAHVWRDADGDGFGSPTDARCGTTTGYVSRRGDCNDGNRLVYPGASDTSGDGLDSDCGGADGAQPHVGLSSSSVGTLAAALSQAAEGTTIWVGPGTYQETGLSFGGRNVRLQSTDMAEKTVVDGNKQGRLFRFVEGETSAALLDGFTLRRGRMNPGDGGAIYIQNSSPMLKNLILVDNQVIGPTDGGHGGAVAAIHANPTIIQCRFEGNRATGLEGPDCLDGCTASGGQGGAIMVYGGEVVVGASEFKSNVAELSQKRGGGGIWVEQATLTVLGSRFDSNDGSTYGGALNLEHAEVTLNQSVLDGNQASVGGGIESNEGVLSISYSTIQKNVSSSRGGAVYGIDSQTTIAHSVIQGNQAQQAGGGLYLVNFGVPSTFDISHSIITENVAPNGGGGYINAISGRFAHNIIGSNAGEFGGGLYLYDYCTPVLTNNIFLNNYGYDVYIDEHWTPTPIIMYNVLNSQESVLTNVEELSATNRFMDPEVLRFTANLNAADDDFMLSPTSEAHDVGDPSILDPDGSPSEPGLGGGPQGAGAYYRDSDADGLYDGWERRYFGNLNANASGDADADGLTNGVELKKGLYPTRSDSDGDGSSDGAESSADSDGLDWYSQPAGWAIASVPADFQTIQAAIDAGQRNVSIELEPGTYRESLYALAKVVRIEGMGRRETVVLDGESKYRLLLGYRSDISLAHLTVKNGSCIGCSMPGGGGVSVSDSNLELDDMYFTQNWGGEGGAVSISRGPARMTDVLFEANKADYTGGAVWGISTELDLSGVHFYRNTAGTDAGAMKVFYPRLVGENLSFLDNQVRRDGGALLVVGESTVNNESYVMMTNIEVRGNVAGTDSAAIYLLNMTGVISHATIVGNTAGLKLAAPVQYTFTLENSITAYNTGYNLLAVSEYNTSQAAARLVANESNSYNPEGSTNCSGVEPNPTHTFFEPGFLSYVGGIPSDPHLAPKSRLVDAGTPGTTDADGSAADLGMFGGSGGAGWDRDFDGYPACFWPGTHSAAPSSVNPGSFDADDLNSAVH